MNKIKSLSRYEALLWTDIETQRGERPPMLRHMIEKTAMDQRHLAMIDQQLETSAFTSVVTGSTGQQKTELNPLLAHRDKVSRTITDDLEALQLTARSLYKKSENTNVTARDNDPTLEYFESINNAKI